MRVLLQYTSAVYTVRMRQVRRGFALQWFSFYSCGLLGKREQTHVVVIYDVHVHVFTASLFIHIVLPTVDNPHARDTGSLQVQRLHIFFLAVSVFNKHLFSFHNPLSLGLDSVNAC